MPEDSDVLCTHPMYGEESGKDSWKGLNFMFERVRIRDEAICSSFLQIFDSEVTGIVYFHHIVRYYDIIHILLLLMNISG